MVFHISSLVLVYVVMLKSSYHEVLGCSVGWTSAGSGCFQYFSDSKDWLSAQMHCVQEGGYLASYDDSSQSGLFTEKLLPAWIGCVRAGANWDYPRWVDDTAASPNWASGEPTDVTVSCVVEDNAGEWFTVGCDHVTGFICREGTLTADKTRMAKATDYILQRERECPWNPSAYAFLFDKTGYCYAFFSSDASRPLVTSLCSGFSGVAVGILHEEENKYLTAKIANDLAAYEGTWLDTSTTSYTNWFPGEPNESTGCFGLFVSSMGTWRDQDCALGNMPVVCRIALAVTCPDDNYCVNGKCEHSACVCDDGWSPSGDDMKCTVCVTNAACEHGGCVLGSCTCDAPWVLDPVTADCTRVSCSGNPDCGHGTCQSGSCVCDVNWQISDVDYTCSVSTLTTTIPVTTTSTPGVSTCIVTSDCIHGSCVTNNCVCDSGWTNAVGGKCTECLTDAACTHGICLSGICDCAASSWGFNDVTNDCTAGTPSTVVRNAYQRYGLFHLVAGGAVTGYTPISSQDTNGAIGCAHACLDTAGCYSFNYDNSVAMDGTCELYDSLYDTNDLTQFGNVQYYKVDVIT